MHANIYENLYLQTFPAIYIYGNQITKINMKSSI